MHERAIEVVWNLTLAQATGGTGELVTPGNPAAASPNGELTAVAPTAQGVSAQPSGGGASSPLGGLMPMVLILGVFMLVMILSSRSQKKEAKRRAELLSSIGKHDTVQTIGGMLGTVVEIRDDEVVLKVDDNSNTRLRFVKSAIQQVVKSAGTKQGGGDSAVEVKANGSGVKV